MKHTKFKTNKLTTAAWTKVENHNTSKKGFMWGGSDGVDHVAREVLQHGVANRGSHPPAMGKALRQSTQHQVSVIPAIYRQDGTAAEKGITATVENREANITRSRANLRIDVTGNPGDDNLEKRPDAHLLPPSRATQTGLSHRGVRHSQAFPCHSRPRVERGGNPTGVE